MVVKRSSMAHSPCDIWTLPALVTGTGAPFVSFLCTMIFTRRRPRLSCGLSIGAVSISFAASLFLLVCHWGMEAPIHHVGRWLVSSDVNVPFGFLVDPLSLLMLAVVSAICLLVQIYSLGYMAEDPGFSRYYAFMSLFAWAMMSLAVSPNLLQLYIFWELVGLSSYLLIGFWYEKFSAAQAGKKAFVMTRAGDVLFFMGVLLVLLHAGNLNIVEINGIRGAEGSSQTIAALSAILIFGGIVGKSAQFPLLTWLPDAMEGPTPVSALLHSATMVAAGVYLFARLFPFFSLSPAAMSLFLAIGTLSMLLASTMAMVSRDIKRVWAYSTISQLGFMIMGLAAGGYFAGVFHLTTHAAFKALLFLCSGVFIHHFGTNDIFKLGAEGATRFKTPFLCLVTAAGALAGIPPLAGFFSKEAIMGALLEGSGPLWLVPALVGVFLTAYYAFRVIFVIGFPGRSAQTPTAQSRPFPSEEVHGIQAAHYRVMVGPLVVLAFVTLFLGFAQGSLESFLLGGEGRSQGHSGAVHGLVAALALALAGAGAGMAWWEFGRKGAARKGLVERIPVLYRLFSERWYLDHVYRFLMDRLVDRGISVLFLQNDNRVIDGTIDGLGKGTAEGGRLLALLQQAMIQYRLMAAFAVVALLTASLFF